MTTNNLHLIAHREVLARRRDRIYLAALCFAVIVVMTSVFTAI